jgi:hypothetical protein
MRGLDGPRFLANHSPSPSAFTPVLSIKGCRASVLRRSRTWTVRDFWRRQRALSSGTGQSSRQAPDGLPPYRRLPQWQPEERLQRQAYLDCRVGGHGLTTAPAGRGPS